MSVHGVETSVGPSVKPTCVLLPTLTGCTVHSSCRSLDLRPRDSGYRNGPSDPFRELKKEGKEGGRGKEIKKKKRKRKSENNHHFIFRILYSKIGKNSSVKSP